MMRAGKSLGLAAAGLGAAFAAQAAQPGEIADLVERAAPAVATVLVERAGAAAEPAQLPPHMRGGPFEEFFRHFGQGPRPQGQPQAALGSGFVIDADGYLVTNDHVVEDAAKITVRFEGLGEYEAELVGTDPATDLALLKIDAENLPALPLGDSDALRVGDEVVAVGNPFGLGGTVTSGIVSALQRGIGDTFVDFIQTDAAINHGNSGGPLMNLAGEVIGVNSAIYSPDGNSVGVGFAIPSDLVEDIVAQLRESGAASHGWLGVRIQSVTPDLAAALGLEQAEGALIADVEPGAPAEKTLRPGDVVLAVDEKSVSDSRALARLVASAPTGETVRLAILRDGDRLDVAVTLGARPGAQEPVREAKGGEAGALGATIAPLTAQARAQLGLSGDAAGAVITSLAPGGAAEKAGLRVGDLVTRAGSTPVDGPEDLRAALANAKGAALLLRVERDGASLFVGVRLA